MSTTPQQLLADPATNGVLTAAQIATLGQQTGLSVAQLMQALVPFAAALAQPVISQYRVGAVALGTSGALYYGANMEFPGEALPFTVHAEQSATTNAWNNGETGLASIAVSAAPCGYCRQFLYEIDTASKLQVAVTGHPATSLSPGLLPQAFGPNDLGVKAALMAPQHVSLQLQQPSNDPVVLAALAAAELSYAPYTGSYAGVAVQDTAGQIHAGRLAENAAYNPSFSPLESAMTMACLAGMSETAIAEVALVELAGAKVSQLAVTQTLVTALGAGPFTYNLAS